MTYLPVYLDYLSNEYGLDTKTWSDKREVKEGRTISNATRKSLSDVHEHVKSAFDVLDGLLCDEDDDNCTDDEPDETKSHIELVGTMRQLFSQN